MDWVAKVGIVSLRYISDQDNNRTVIEVFGRCEDGSSVCLLYSSLSPSFEIAPKGKWEEGKSLDDFILSNIDSLQRIENVDSVERVNDKWTDLGVKPVWKVTAKQPFHVPKLRKDLYNNWSIFSGDIPFTNRFCLDLDIGMHFEIKATVLHKNGDDKKLGAKKVAEAGGSGLYPVDYIVTCGPGNISACEAFPTPFKIYSFDLETSIQHDTILCSAVVCENMLDGSRSVHEFRGSEESILIGMNDLLRDFDPDIITGYNIDNFDLPRIVERANILRRASDHMGKAELIGWGRTPIQLDEMKRTRDSLQPRRSSNKAWSLAGRAIVDAWWQARMELRPQRETLSFVSALLFPDDDDKQKMDIDSSKMDEEWANRPDEVMAYCVRDAELPLDILHAIQAIRRKEALASVAKLPFERAANGSTSTLIDSLVIRLADSWDIAVPLTGSADKKEGQIAGGYVHDVEAGLHPWIAILDFKSMYPSIMIGHNICYTTRLDSSQEVSEAEQSMIHTAPSGVRYWGVEKRQGLIPYLLKDLMAQRDFHKSELKSAKAVSDDISASFHDSMQYAVKILMNSFYGVFASEFYRFTHRDLGSSITAWARHNIKMIIEEVEKEGHPVVYSDTDSIFVKSPMSGEVPGILLEEATAEERQKWEEAKQNMVDFGIALASKYSRDSAVLEFETGMSVFFSHGAKKRYVGQVVWPNDKMMIKGYETQRTDSFEFLVSAMKQIFTFALAGQNDQLVDYARKAVDDLKKGLVDVQQLVLSKSCKGSVSKKINPSTGEEQVSVDFSKHYARPDSMAQVRAAKQLLDMGLGFTPGMKVSFVVTDGSKSPMQVQAWLAEQENGGVENYDGIFYAERLASALGRITEAFGWDAKDLIRGNKQTSLFSF